jgi:hypothetical protein
MSAKRRSGIATAEASAKAVPARETKPKRGLENPRSFSGDGQGAEGDSGETWGMNDWQTCAVPDSFVKHKIGRQNQI